MRLRLLKQVCFLLLFNNHLLKMSKHFKCALLTTLLFYLQQKSGPDYMLVVPNCMTETFGFKITMVQKCMLVVLIVNLKWKFGGIRVWTFGLFLIDCSVLLFSFFSPGSSYYGSCKNISIYMIAIYPSHSVHEPSSTAK